MKYFSFFMYNIFFIHITYAVMETLAGLALVTAIIGGLFRKQIGQKLGYLEGCEDKWITLNMLNLSEDLNKNVYGQELAIEEILRILHLHYKGKNYRDKPLVLSFHGMPGTGKNYVSDFIKKNMFKIGSRSEYAHFYSGTLDFPIKKKTWMYRAQLENDIQKKIMECHRSVFIFDEVEKMPKGILDVLYPFMLRNANVEGINYSKLLFIFLSNIAQQNIMNLTLEMWKRGLRRDQYSLKKFQNVIEKAAFMEEGGLHNTDLVRGKVIDSYIPFLPLEREHVIQCITRDILNLNQTISRELIETVMKDMTFIEEFSTSGCKKADNIVKMLIHHQHLKNEGFL